MKRKRASILLRSAAVLLSSATQKALKEGLGGHSCEDVKGGMSFGRPVLPRAEGPQARSVSHSYWFSGPAGIYHSYHSFVNHVCFLPEPGPHRRAASVLHSLRPGYSTAFSVSSPNLEQARILPQLYLLVTQGQLSLRDKTIN